MATGSGLSHSILYSSDEGVENPCSICLTRDNKTVESTHFCVECDGHLCTPCTNWHEEFPGTAGHQVVDNVNTLLTEHCEEHPDELVDTFCPIHENLCCASCVTIHHEKCENVQYIPTTSRGVKQSQEYASVATSTEDVTKQLIAMMSSRLDVLNKLDSEEKIAQKSIHDLRQRLIKRINDLTKAEYDKIKYKYQGVRELTQKDIKAVEHQLEATEICSKRLVECQGDNEPQLFINMKHGKANERKSKHLINLIKRSDDADMLKYKIDKAVESYLSEKQSLGEFESAQQLTLERSYNVRTVKDKSVCNIKGICALPNGLLVLADYQNNCLKKLDHLYRVVQSLTLSDKPFDVCYVDSVNEVAVTLFSERKIQFVKIEGTMAITRFFRVSEPCTGICFSNGELFVCFGGHAADKIHVFNPSGKTVRIIQYPRLSDMHYITASSNGSKLHATDPDQGVITFDRAGNLMCVYSCPGLDASGICTLDGHDLLVTGYRTNRILHIPSDGKKLVAVLKKQDGVENPLAINYDCVNRKVILSTDKSDTIKVYLRTKKQDEL